MAPKPKGKIVRQVWADLLEAVKQDSDGLRPFESLLQKSRDTHSASSWTESEASPTHAHNTEEDFDQDYPPIILLDEQHRHGTPKRRHSFSGQSKPLFES